MVERGDVCDILRGGVGEVEYERKVAWVKNLASSVAIGMEDGEVIHTDLLIGKKEVYSR